MQNQRRQIKFSDDELSLNSINARRMVRKMRKIMKKKNLWTHKTKQSYRKSSNNGQFEWMRVSSCMYDAVELQFNRISECDHSTLHTEQRECPSKAMKMKMYRIEIENWFFAFKMHSKTFKHNFIRNNWDEQTKKESLLNWWCWCQQNTEWVNSLEAKRTTTPKQIVVQ